MEPGASEVLTQAGTCNPRSTAFFASSPAAIITDGLEVFVQLVIAAITTEPWRSSQSWPSSLRLTCVRRLAGASRVVTTAPPSASQRPLVGVGAATVDVG